MDQPMKGLQYLLSSLKSSHFFLVNTVERLAIFQICVQDLKKKGVIDNFLYILR